MTRRVGPPWRVRRLTGLLVPGFTKQFAPDGSYGLTSFAGVPIGWFDVVASDRPGVACELRYRRWPVVDLLGDVPRADGPPVVSGSGMLRLPGARLRRFCRFSLDLVDASG